MIKYLDKMSEVVPGSRKDHEIGCDKLFLRLDLIQESVFSKVFEIVNLTGKKDDLVEDNESIENKRSEIVKEATLMFKEFSDILQILDIKITQHKDKSLGLDYEIYREKLDNMNIRLRKAQLQSYNDQSLLAHRQRIHKYLKKEEKETDIEKTREKLFAGKSIDQEVGKEQTGGEEVLTQNKSITHALRATRTMMNTSLMQSELNIESLDQQTKDVSRFDDMLTDFQSLLLKSKQIVKFIERQDRQDKNRIYLSIGFFLICCAWVLWRRIFKLPVKILIWTLLKLIGIADLIVPSSKPLRVSPKSTYNAISAAGTLVHEATTVPSDFSSTINTELTKTIVADEL